MTEPPEKSCLNVSSAYVHGSLAERHSPQRLWGLTEYTQKGPAHPFRGRGASLGPKRPAELARTEGGGMGEVFN